MLLSVSASLIFPAPAYAALYAPGATLDPACAPTDPDCGVQAPVGAGTPGQVPYYADAGGVLTATSSITILPTGNVGISKGLNIAGATSTAYALTLSTNNDQLSWQSFQDAAGNEYASLFNGGSPTSRAFTLNFNGVSGERSVSDNYFVMRFNGGGNKLFFGDTGSVAQIQAVHNLDLSAGTVGSTTPGMIRITTAGNVGIGTTSPTTKLTTAVNQANNNNGITIQNTNASGWGSGLFFNINGGGQYNSAAIKSDTASTGGILYLQTANTSNVLQDRVTIDNAGYVTLATGLAGNTKVAINNVSGNTSGLTIQNTNTSGWGGSLFFNTNYLGTQYNAAAIASDRDTIGEFMYFQTSTNGGALSTKATLDYNGNLGIGTGAPTYKLDVAGLARFTGLVDAANFNATSTSATSTFLGGFTAGNNAAFVVNRAAAANSLYINPSGNVGIGTSNPSAKLDVQGGYVNSSGGLKVTGMTTPTGLGPEVVYSGGSGYFQTYDRTGGAYLPTVVEGLTTTLNTGGTARLTILNNGLVGIGTNPNVTLDVRATSADASTRVAAFYQPGLSTANLYSYISVGKANATDQAAVFGFLNNTAGNDSAFMVVAGDDPAAGTGLYVRKGGNVGIGSTTPYGLLSVAASTTAPATIVQQTTNMGAGTAMSFLGGTAEYGNIRGLGMAVKGTLKDNTNMPTAFQVDVSGKYAYVVGQGGSRLTVIDVSDPSGPTLTGSVSNGLLSASESVKVVGRYAYVGSASRFSVVDVSNPAVPAVVGSVASSTALSNVMSIYVSGRYAYVISYSTNRLTVIDISDPTTPTVVGTLLDNTNFVQTYSVHVTGRYAYVAAYNASNTGILSVVDVSNPAAPLLVGSVTTAGLGGAGRGGALTVSGRYAYIASYDSGKLAVFDISNPAAPTLATSLTVGGNPTALAISGHYVYISNDTTARITMVDIASSTAPSVVSFVSDPVNLASIRDVKIVGRYLYGVTQYDNRLTIVDLPGIDMPNALVGNLQSTDITTWNNIYSGNDIYARNGLIVGTGGILSHGPLSVSLASTTVTNTVSAYFQGNVGIGSTTPSAKLSIAGLGTGTGRTLSLVDSSNADTFFVLDNGNAYHKGSLGIGTTTPFSKLSITGAGTGTGRGLSVADSTNLDTFYVLDNGNAYHKGSVGIGTVSPNGKLQIAADIAANPNTGVYAQLELTGATNAAKRLSLGYNTTGNYGLIQSITNGVSFDSLNLNPSGGFIGIGTTTPLAALTVGGISGATIGANYNVAAPTSGLLVEGSVGIGTRLTTGGKLNVVSGTEPSYGGYTRTGAAIFVSPTVNTASDVAAPNAAETVITLVRGGVSGLVHASIAELQLSKTAVGLGGNTRLDFRLLNANTSDFGTPLSLLSSGNVGIGSTTPWRTLSVTGTVALNGLTSSATGNALCITTTKDITDAGGASCVPSSIRFKENVETLIDGFALDELNKLRVVSFDYKPGFYSTEDAAGSYGLIAEEVATVDSKLVDYGYDGQPLTLKFEKLTGLAIQAIQELSKTVKGFAERFVTKKVETEELCIDGTCISGDEFRALLNGSQTSSSGSGSLTSPPVGGPDAGPITITDVPTEPDPVATTTEPTPIPPDPVEPPPADVPVDEPPVL